MKLTIGAYFNKVPGTIGISLEKGPATDEIMDARKLTYGDNTIEEIYSYDMIEHIPTKDVMVMFNEWYRVLKVGGRLEISTVDLEGICREFLAGTSEKRKALINHFYGSQSFDSDFHYTGFDFNILKDYLTQVGFKSVEREVPSYQWGGTLSIKAFKE
jgi:predicted SAM-dependent methyltransferase